MKQPDAVSRIRPYEQGFTLVEAVVSFTLLIIVATATLAGLANGVKATGASRAKTQANNIARQYLDAARLLTKPGTSDLTPISVTGANSPGMKVCTVFSAVAITPSQTAGWDPAGSTCPSPTAPCAAGTLGAFYYVTVVVGVPSNFGTTTSSGYRVIRTDTVLACGS